jgi:phosphoglycolate phosphatase
MNPKLSALIFDFEGTLVDFQWRLEEAEAEAGQLLAVLGLVEKTQAKVHYAEGMNLALEHQERTGLSQGVLSLAAIYDRYDADALVRWQIRPGVQDILSLLRKRGLKTGLVSNVGLRSLEEALIRLDLMPFLDVIISRNEARWLKPHPRGIDLACERLGCSKETVCFLGDSLDDILAAKRAGVPVIIVSGGQHSPETIQESGPDGIIRDWQELLLCLEQKGWLT